MCTGFTHTNTVTMIIHVTIYMSEIKKNNKRQKKPQQHANKQTKKRGTNHTYSFAFFCFEHPANNTSHAKCQKPPTTKPTKKNQHRPPPPPQKKNTRTLIHKQKFFIKKTKEKRRFLENTPFNPTKKKML